MPDCMFSQGVPVSFDNYIVNTVLPEIASVSGKVDLLQSSFDGLSSMIDGLNSSIQSLSLENSFTRTLLFYNQIIFFINILLYLKDHFEKMGEIDFSSGRRLNVNISYDTSSGGINWSSSPEFFFWEDITPEMNSQNEDTLEYYTNFEDEYRTQNIFYIVGYVDFCSISFSSEGFTDQEKTDLFTLLLKNFYKSGLNTSILSILSEKVLSRSWLDGILSKSTPTNEDWRLLDGSASQLPAVIDLGLDGIDTAVDTVDSVSNRISDFRDLVDDIKNDFESFAEHAKLDLLVASQYNPEIFNRNLGNALNFNLPKDENGDFITPVVQKVDSPLSFESFWEFLMDIVDDLVCSDDLRWNYDFRNFAAFKDDTGQNTLYLSNELKYINAKFPRWGV